MKPQKLTFTFSLFLLLSCTRTNDCKDDINLLPMYGGQKKCQDQMDADNLFLHRRDSMFSDRKLACKYQLDRAWEYFYANILDTAMFRFNQAWLLDSTNADIYWGFGNLLGKQQNFEESLKYFEKSLKMNSNNSNVWLCASTSYGQLFYKSKDINLLNKSIEYLKIAVSLDPNNAIAYGQLTAAYTYFEQKDSAMKYLNITDKINPSAVKPAVRQFITGK